MDIVQNIRGRAGVRAHRHRRLRRRVRHHRQDDAVHLWKEIVEEKNLALAVLVGAMSIGICIIIAAAVH